MKTAVLALCAGCALSLSLVGSASALPFTPGNIAVLRVVSATGGAPTNVGTQVFIDEYLPTTVGQAGPVQSISVPTTTVGGQRRLVLSGSATSEGGLSLSADGRYLLFGGYDAALGTAVTPLLSAATPRTIGRIDASGNLDTSTVLGNGEFGGSNFRSVASIDGNLLYAGGNGATGAGGVRTITYGTQTSGGNPGVLIETGIQNVRRVSIQNNQLYISAQTSAQGLVGVGSVGSGVPNTSGQLVSTLINTAGTPTGSNYDFYFASTTTCYVADTNSTATVGGVQRWDLVGSSWVRQYILSGGLSTGISGLTGRTDGAGNVYLAGVQQDGSRLSFVFDNLANTSLSTLNSWQTLALPGTGNLFRGVAIPTPGALALVGLGGLLASRRRR